MGLQVTTRDLTRMILIQQASTVDNGLGEQVGGWFELIPNQTNRFIWIRATYSSGADTYTGITKANTSSLTVYYWPRYIFIRPSAT